MKDRAKKSSIQFTAKNSYESVVHKLETMKRVEPMEKYERSGDNHSITIFDWIKYKIMHNNSSKKWEFLDE
jgi:hypothetical protein